MISYTPPELSNDGTLCHLHPRPGWAASLTTNGPRDKRLGWEHWRGQEPSRNRYGGSQLGEGIRKISGSHLPIERPFAN